MGTLDAEGRRAACDRSADALSQIVALRVHLDDSTVENGPLRVLPGTHVHGVLPRSGIDNLTSSMSPAECPVLAGGVIAMRPLTAHASSKARNDQARRVLHIEFAAQVAFDGGIELAVG